MPLTHDGDKTMQKFQHRRGTVRPRSVRGSWFELVLFFLMAAGIYVIAALLGGAWTGASGRYIGTYLRTVWGGAVLVPLLFWQYLCAAWFLHFRVPRPLGQILGTVQLYLSIAFMLGLFRRVGWSSEWLVAEPGRVGDGLAHFFVLNLGVLGTVLVAFASLFLAGLFFGSRFSSLLSALFRSSPSGGASPETPLGSMTEEGDLAAPRRHTPRPPDPSPVLKDREPSDREPFNREPFNREPSVARRRERGLGGARLVRNASPGGVPFDPLKPAGAHSPFGRQGPEPDEPEAIRPISVSPLASGGETETGRQGDGEVETPSFSLPVSEEEEAHDDLRAKGAFVPGLPASEEESGEEEAPRLHQGAEGVRRPSLSSEEGALDETPSDPENLPERLEFPEETERHEGLAEACAVVSDGAPDAEVAEDAKRASSQTTVEILDHLLAFLDSGAFDVPVPPKQESSIERPSERSSIRRPPVRDLMESPVQGDFEKEVFERGDLEKKALEKALPTGAWGDEEEPASSSGDGEAVGGRGVIEACGTPKAGPEESLREFREQLAPSSPAERPAEVLDGGDTAVQKVFPDVVLPEEEGELRFRAGVFPPPLDILGPPVRDPDQDDTLELAEGQARVIVDTLQNFGVKATVAHIVVGPSVIQFQIELAPGIKVSKVAGLANDLTMALAVVSVRVEAPILGQRYVGIEIPNAKRKGIALRSVMESEEFQQGKFLLPLPMGMRVDSRYLVCGLEDMPHLLVAGTTGSGKSVFVNGCILGMCLRRPPEELRLILVDPKHVEFAIYEGLPHLLARPISDSRKAIDALTWAVQEMETRTENFARARVRSLAPYNEKVLPKDRYPNIVVVVDELADLMYTAGKEVESLIARLAQKSRAAGIHLILATQRPSVDVITGLIKANVPARVAFAVPSQTDSRTIIDVGGADKLLGKGDMLFRSTRFPRPLRLQSPFITEERTLDFVEYMKGVFGPPDYIEFADSNGGGSGDGRGGNGAVDDPKMEEAIRTVMETGITSASGLQRLLSIGYPKAGRLITAMEQLGIVGPQTPNSTKPRQILLDEESAFEALERARTGGIFDED